MLDVASIHPQLQPKRLVENYFTTTSILKKNANDALLLAFNACHYTAYLVNNTTSGLMAVLSAAALCERSIALQGPASQHHSPYLDLFRDKNTDSDWHVRTHVSPVTGQVDHLVKGKAKVLIVDAAQSFGTCLFPELLEHSDAIIAPLHKHAGLVTGLALVWIKTTGAYLAEMHQVMKVAQNGCTSLDSLEKLHARLKINGARIFNRAVITCNHSMRSWCLDRGLSICGDSEKVPFVCITTTDGKSIQSRLKTGNWKYFENHNTARYSFYARGEISDPLLDFSDELKNLISSQLK